MQAATDNKALVRARSSMDSWALGVMAFELLSGEMVFDPTKMTIDDVRPPQLRPTSVAVLMQPERSIIAEASTLSKG